MKTTTARDAFYAEARMAMLGFIYRNPSLKSVTDSLSDARLAAVINDLSCDLQQGLPVLPPADLAEELHSSPARLVEWQRVLRRLNGGNNGLSGGESALLAIGLLWLTLLEQATRDRGRKGHFGDKPAAEAAKPFS